MAVTIVVGAQYGGEGKGKIVAYLALRDNADYVVRCGGHRDALMAHLTERGVWAGIHYPVPMPRLRALVDLGFDDAVIPEADRMAREVLSLPVYAEMSDEQVDYVIESAKAFF